MSAGVRECCKGVVLVSQLFLFSLESGQPLGVFWCEGRVARVLQGCHRLQKKIIIIIIISRQTDKTNV